MLGILSSALDNAATWQSELNRKIHTMREALGLNIHPDFNVPDILAHTLYELEGCEGNFRLYFEDANYYHDRYKVNGDFVMVDAGKENTPATYIILDSVHSMLAFCLHLRWRGVKLIWQSDWIDDRFQFGYNSCSCYVSNAKVIRNKYGDKDVFVEDDGITFDVRFISENLLETIVELENYPIISEDDLTQLEEELQDEAWKQWAADEWRGAVIRQIQDYIDQSTQPDLDPEDYIGGKDDADLFRLFQGCCATTNEYWEEQGNRYYIDIQAVAKGITINDIRDLTKLNLLSASQQS